MRAIVVSLAWALLLCGGVRASAQSLPCNPYASPSTSGPPALIAEDGTFLGRLSANRFDPDSTSNPYGRYGSPYSPESINNPFGLYGSPYSPYSANNPFTTTAPRIVNHCLGRLSLNPYDPDSTGNPYGVFGSPFSPSSINNPYSLFGNPYSPNSATNPHTTANPSSRFWAPPPVLPLVRSPFIRGLEAGRAVVEADRRRRDIARLRQQAAQREQVRAAQIAEAVWQVRRIALARVEEFFQNSDVADPDLAMALATMPTLQAIAGLTPATAPNPFLTAYQRLEAAVAGPVEFYVVPGTSYEVISTGFIFTGQIDNGRQVWANEHDVAVVLPLVVQEHLGRRYVKVTVKRWGEIAPRIGFVPVPEQ